MLKILQMQRYLTHMPSRFPDNPRLNAAVQTAISNIDCVLGRDQVAKQSIDETSNKTISKL
ncbi:hypothetical protein WK66_17355 [Burkholderia ubonensis]|nr:hypothetical protein WK66_17355 [Burkholderia ubonensis]